VFAGKFVFSFVNNGLGYPRLGVGVSKRVTSSAVRRNHIKRINRECFRNRQTVLGGVDIVVGVRKSINSVPKGKLYQYTKKQWEYFLSRYGSYL